MDQPLYSLAKTLQWNFPDAYGESQFFIMFGALHIEQNFLKVFGKYLSYNGWTNVLEKAGVVSLGVAESYITV